MERLPVVAEIMDTVFLHIDSDTPVKEAVDILGRKKLFGACVVDKAGGVLGVLSEKECLRLYGEAFNSQKPELLKERTVTEIMRPDFKTVPSTMSLFDVVQIFFESEFRRMPVVDSGKLVGQITRRDLVRAIQKFVKKESFED